MENKTVVNFARKYFGNDTFVPTENYKKFVECCRKYAEDPESLEHWYGTHGMEATVKDMFESIDPLSVSQDGRKTCIRLGKGTLQLTFHKGHQNSAMDSVSEHNQQLDAAFNGKAAPERQKNLPCGVTYDIVWEPGTNPDKNKQCQKAVSKCDTCNANLTQDVEKIVSDIQEIASTIPQYR